MRRPTDDGLRAWRAFLESHQAVMRNLERRHDHDLELPLSWYDVLVQLSEADGGRRRMTDLADAVLLSRSGLTRLVDRMERRGYVHREICDSDRRGFYAVLTATGREALEDAAPPHLEGVAEHFTDHLEPEEVDVLRRALVRVRKANRRELAAHD